MKQVWQAGPSYANDRSVLLVLVDCMNVHCRAWPSVQTIADRVGISDRAVRDRLRSLEADGWITPESKGGGRHRTTTYIVNVAMFGNPAETRQQRPGKKPGRNPEVDARNPEVDDINPAATSAERLERLGNGRRARGDSVDNRQTVDDDGPPPPCPTHPTGWHHDDPCRRCMALREYDERKRAAQPLMRPRRDDEMCGDCDRGWIDAPGGVRPCPNGCRNLVPVVDGEEVPVDETRSDRPRNGKRLDEPVPIASAVPAAFNGLTRGDKRHMMRGVGRR